jgi:hypothetical protein
VLRDAGEHATAADVPSFERAAEAVVAAAHGRIDVYLVAARDADVGTTVLPLIRDSAGDFARMYAAQTSAVYVVHPNGYVSFTSPRIETDGLIARLSSTFRASVSTMAGADLR